MLKFVLEGSAALLSLSHFGPIFPFLPPLSHVPSYILMPPQHTLTPPTSSCNAKFSSCPPSHLRSGGEEESRVMFAHDVVLPYGSERVERTTWHYGVHARVRQVNCRRNTLRQAEGKEEKLIKRRNEIKRKHGVSPGHPQPTHTHTVSTR